jgi:hypothetical protein
MINFLKNALSQLQANQARWIMLKGLVARLPIARGERRNSCEFPTAQVESEARKQAL